LRQVIRGINAIRRYIKDIESGPELKYVLLDFGVGSFCP